MKKVSVCFIKTVDNFSLKRYEETCYGYHPYKEKDYKKTREEKIQEKKDELIDKYTEEFNLMNELISKYKCHQCDIVCLIFIDHKITPLEEM